MQYLKNAMRKICKTGFCSSPYLRSKIHVSEISEEHFSVFVTIVFGNSTCLHTRDTYVKASTPVYSVYNRLQRLLRNNPILLYFFGVVLVLFFPCHVKTKNIYDVSALYYGSTVLCSYHTTDVRPKTPPRDMSLSSS